MRRLACLAALLALVACAPPAPGEPPGVEMRIDLEPPATPVQDPDMPQDEGFGPDFGLPEG